ncbi:unnamed protein product, partial [Ectocarpus sp. 8 AP-2014]
ENVGSPFFSPFFFVVLWLRPPSLRTTGQREEKNGLCLAQLTLVMVVVVVVVVLVVRRRWGRRRSRLVACIETLRFVVVHSFKGRRRHASNMYMKNLDQPLKISNEK